jgi:hypothetical protein
MDATGCAQMNTHRADTTILLARNLAPALLNPREFGCIKGVVDINMCLWFKFNGPR